MIAADDIEKEIKAANAKKAERREPAPEGERGHLLGSRRSSRARKAACSKNARPSSPRFPPDQLKLYLRISKKMNGVALSPVTDDFCSLCQMRIRPQMLNELMEMKKIIICEACGRILYWQKPKDEDIPEEKLDNPDKADDSSAG